MWYSIQINTNIIALVAASLFLWLPVCAASDQVHVVDELPYGVALYDFYQDKYFSSITDILVAKKNQTLVDKNKNSELLLGSLYLSYGIQDRAHEIFNSITLNSGQTLPKSILDQAWFHIGKDYYMGGFREKAKQSLLMINDNQKSTLSNEYESERLNILSEIYLHDNKYDDVVHLLELFPEDSIWQQYTKFNLGVNLIKNERQDEGLLLLKSVAALQPSNQEIDMLHDQADLALATSYTKAGDLDSAVKYFEDIKLANPQSNSALLGLGWAKYKKSSYGEAISTWQELSKRPKSDSNVQEALMLIPFALEKNGERENALAQYDFAVETFKQQLNSVKKVKSLIQQGEVIRILKLTAYREGRLDSKDMTKIMGPELSDYLFELVVSSEFKQAVSRYRELAVLRNKLSLWKRTIPSMSLILDEKINTYNNRLSVVIKSLKFDYAKKLHNKREDFVEQLEKSLSSNKMTVLLNKHENKLFSILNNVKSGLDKVDNNNPDVIEIKEKYRFLSGLLEWNVSTDYAPRLWAVKTSISELDNALQAVHRTIQSLTTAWETAPATHQLFREKIKGKDGRIKALMRDIDQVMSVQEQKIQLLAEAAIDQYRYHLKQYHDRALFARARVYDSIVRQY